MRAPWRVGLGLYIVQRFVDQLSGETHVEGTPGVGSVFRISLPAPEVTQPAETAEQHANPPVLQVAAG